DAKQADAWYNLGVLYQQQQRQDEAVDCFLQAVALQPDSLDAWNNLGVLMQQQNRYAEASDYFLKVVALQPNDAGVWHNLGVLAQEQGHYDEAIGYYRHAVQLKPNYITAIVNLVHTEQKVCDWRSLAQLRSLLIEPALAWREDNDTPPPEPFPFLAMPAITETEQLAIAQTFSRYKQRGIQPFPSPPSPPDPLSHKGRGGGMSLLRLGYLSSDFCNHPVAHQTSGIFKRHNRHRFEVFAYSIGEDDGSSYRRRIEDDVDHFVDLCWLSDQEAAQRIRDDGIDILIDLNGHTRGSRPQILAYRPAAVQMVHSLPTGSAATDYLLTDRFFIPPERQHHYREKIVYLPHSAMATDCEQPIAATTPDRPAHGLPEQGFVFCSFNNHYKIGPHIFDIWMAVLRQVPESMLWLKDGAGRDNLQREAAKRGVAPQRLVFAPSLPDKADHLARHRWADLFLDTFYANAQTTACDALWAGVPVLTCPGDTSFAARASVSLLHAIGLQDDGLIVATLDQYQQRAIELATHPKELARIRQKLWANRLTQPLFDTDRFVRDLETVLEQIAPPYPLTPSPTRGEGALDHLRAALSAYQHNDHQQAWSHCQQALQQDDSLADGWTIAGMLEDAAHHTPEAIACYQRAIALKPSCADPYHNLGNLFHRQNQVAEALSCYQQAIQLQPDCVAAYYNMGILLQQQQRHDEAIGYYRQALALKPDHADGWYNLGLLLQGQNRLDEAIHHYRQAITHQPNHADSWYNLGIILQGQNQLSEAIRHYEQAIACKPDHIPARVFLVHNAQKLCDWRSLAHLRQSLIEPALAWQEENATPPPEPFPFLSMPDISEAEQQHLARTCARYKQKGIQPLPPLL
ncbi:MAG: tetratricopeptide repeat protein, partial [Magnetococcales bacterium]|nr:tetratricopeptide repeat protein [Magnetococcales bacterium]